MGLMYITFIILSSESSASGHVGRKGLNFGRTEWLAPPHGNGPATPIAISNISVPGLHDDVMGSAGEEGSHGHHTVYT